MTHLYKICHQSGRVLFTMTARNREQFGWKVIEVDKSREQFEEVAAKILNFSISTVIACRNGDNYDSGMLSIWWKFWQASRAAIEIELPDSTEFDGPDMSGAQQAISQIRKMLTETGIRAKS